jgi:hypothetical protein
MVPMPQNATSEALELEKMIERACADLPDDYSRYMVRNVARLKLSIGRVDEVKEYLARRVAEANASQRSDPSIPPS